MTDTPSAPAAHDPVVEERHDADPSSEMPRDSGPAWERMEDQVNWYDKSSIRNKQWFTGLKIVQLICAAAVPVMASVHAAVWVTGGLGAVVVVVEGIQQLGQYQANWINYRSTAEALNHEKYLYLSDAGRYQTTDDPRRVLAERVEALISQENSTWTAGREQASHADHDAAATGTPTTMPPKVSGKA